MSNDQVGLSLVEVLRSVVRSPTLSQRSRERREETMYVDLPGRLLCRLPTSVLLRFPPLSFHRTAPSEPWSSLSSGRTGEGGGGSSSSTGSGRLRVGGYVTVLHRVWTSEGRRVHHRFPLLRPQKEDVGVIVYPSTGRPWGVRTLTWVPVPEVGTVRRGWGWVAVSCGVLPVK